MADGCSTINARRSRCSREKWFKRRRPCRGTWSKQVEAPRAKWPWERERKETSLCSESLFRLRFNLSLLFWIVRQLKESLCWMQLGDQKVVQQRKRCLPIESRFIFLEQINKSHWVCWSKVFGGMLNATCVVTALECCRSYHFSGVWRHLQRKFTECSIGLKAADMIECSHVLCGS
jgi:hypothetical protein